jgi:hypothetical protein
MSFPEKTQETLFDAGMGRVGVVPDLLIGCFVRSQAKAVRIREVLACGSESIL